MFVYGKLSEKKSKFIDILLKQKTVCNAWMICRCAEHQEREEGGRERE